MHRSTNHAQRATNQANAIIHRICTPRIVLRCWDPADAPLLLEAITASLDHLRSWMPWAASEPLPVNKKAAQLQRWRARFDAGRDFVFGMFTPDERQVIGGVGAHTRIGAGAREIGYWIRADRIGQGLATEATAALTKVGFELQQLHRIEIQCDPKNIASAAIPRKLGYTHQLTIAQRVLDAKSGPRDTMIWSMGPATYAHSPAAVCNIKAFDAQGKIVLQ